MMTSTDLVGNWSIAPPDPCVVDVAGGHHGRLAAVGHAKAKYFDAAAPGSPSAYLDGSSSGSCISRDHQFAAAATPSFLRPVSQVGLMHQHNAMLAGELCGGGMDVPWGGANNLSDLISFTAAMTKPPADGRAALKNTAFSGGAASPHEANSSSRHKSSGDGGRKKMRAADDGAADTANAAKKNKVDGSSSPAASTLKTQVPKVKIADKITALQQIVSPFGKTDTASVLHEAINYIKFLHEQVQLLSDPYMKSSSSKDLNACWAGLERPDADADLRSRGLCLVPVSCTPQVYRDNSMPDYWTPAYRSCLYR